MAPAEADAPSRLIERAFPSRDLVGLLVSCLIVVVAFSPILFFGHTLSAAGTGRAAGTNGYAPFPGQPRLTHSPDFRARPRARPPGQFEPWAEVTHRAYSDGEIPLWNPYQAAGAPHAANMQSAVFDPLLLAVNLHPTPLTWDLSIIGAFVLGAAAAYLFGRILGLRVVPAVVSQRRVLSQRVVLPVQQQPLQPLVRLPAAALPPRGARAALAAVVLPVLGARRRRRGKHLRRDARSVVLRDRRRLRVRGGSARAGANDDADAHLPRSTRRRGPAGLAARRAARALVPGVRVPVVQHLTSRSWTGVRRRILLGASSTGSFRGSRAPPSPLQARETGSASRS